MYTIPKIIHQIWIGPKSLPLFWLNSFQIEFASSNPEWLYKLWTNDNIHSIIYSMDPTIKTLYNSIPDEQKHYCHKADILRLIILKLYL